MEDVTLAAKVDGWVREAVALWGDDWPRVSAHIERQMALLNRREREKFRQEVRVTLQQVVDEPCH